MKSKDVSSSAFNGRKNNKWMLKLESEPRRQQFSIYSNSSKLKSELKQRQLRLSQHRGFRSSNNKPKALGQWPIFSECKRRRKLKNEINCKPRKRKKGGCFGPTAATTGSH